MDATEAARREAERIHQAAVADGVDPWNLLELVSREAALRDLDVYALATGDSALKGGRAVLDREAECILYEDIGSAFDRAFLIAHELGHFVLEGDAQNVVTGEVEPGRSAVRPKMHRSAWNACSTTAPGNAERSGWICLRASSCYRVQWCGTTTSTAVAPPPISPHASEHPYKWSSSNCWIRCSCRTSYLPSWSLPQHRSAACGCCS